MPLDVYPRMPAMTWSFPFYGCITSFCLSPPLLPTTYYSRVFLRVITFPWGFFLSNVKRGVLFTCLIFCNFFFQWALLCLFGRKNWGLLWWWVFREIGSVLLLPLFIVSCVRTELERINCEITELERINCETTFHEVRTDIDDPSFPVFYEQSAATILSEHDAQPRIYPRKPRSVYSEVCELPCFKWRPSPMLGHK